MIQKGMETYLLHQKYVVKEGSLYLNIAYWICKMEKIIIDLSESQIIYLVPLITIEAPGRYAKVRKLTALLPEQLVLVGFWWRNSEQTRLYGSCIPGSSWTTCDINIERGYVSTQTKKGWF